LAAVLLVLPPEGDAVRQRKPVGAIIVIADVLKPHRIVPTVFLDDFDAPHARRLSR
jgi:hypothetical protein